MTIVVTTYDDNWRAYVQDNPGIWEIGASAMEALGKLVWSLACQSHGEPFSIYVVAL